MPKWLAFWHFVSHAPRPRHGRGSVLTLLQEKYLKKKAQKHVQQAGIHGI
jgi:hypothetical protein